MTEKRARCKGILFIIAALAAATVASALPAGEEYTAIVCFLEGKAWLAGPASQERRELQLFDWLPAGGRVETAPGSRLIVAFMNGDRYEFKGEAKAAVGRKGFASVSGAVEKIAAVAAMPRIAELAAESKPGSRLSGIRLRGSSRQIVGLYPSDGASALADEAVLSFTPLEGVEKYRVVVDDEWGNSVFSVETNSSRVVISAGILKPGFTYYWSVRTLEKTRPSAFSEAAFMTLSAEKAKARNKFRFEVDKSQDASQHLLFAQVDMVLGLRQEACLTLRKVLSLHGPNAEVQKALERLGCK